MDFEQQAVLSDPKEEIVQLLTSQMETIKEKLSEIKLQVEQTELVVKREQQRHTDIATELRLMQDNLETTPRQDIKSKYDEAMDVHFRLTTMRGQLEKFEAVKQALTQQQTLMSQLLGTLQGVDVLTAGGDNGDNVAKAAGTNIVRIIQAQEEERQRLSLQIHDGPAQSLTNFILQAEICQRLFNRDPVRAAEELDNLKTAASVTFQKVREFIFDLRPMMLDDLGVVPTVRRYVDSFREKNDIEVNLEITGEERRLESHREVMLFRAIQELMVNARDYAAASQIDIKVDMSGNRIKVAVSDNGRHFDVEAAFMSEEAHLDARTQGLVTLREKFELVRGSVAVNSTEGEGTLVRLELPVSDPTA